MVKKRRRRRRRNRPKRKLNRTNETTDNDSIDKSINQKQLEEYETYTDNNKLMMETTPVNKTKILNNRSVLNNNSGNSDFCCTNLNILFNNTGMSNESSNNILNIDESKLINTNKNDIRTTINVQLNQSSIHDSNLSKIENNLIIHNQRIFVNQTDLLDNYCEDYLQKPLYTSSPLYPTIKLNNDDKMIINNKAHKDEINLQRLNSFNDISIYATCNVQSLKSPSKIKSTNLINISNHLSEKSFDEHKINYSKLLKRKKCNKSRTISEIFLHNISVTIISRLKRFSSRYITKWIEKILSLCSWMGTLISRKDASNNRFGREHPTFTKSNYAQQLEQQQLTISAINTKIDKLTFDLDVQHKQTTELLLSMKDRLDGIEEKLNGYDKIKTELVDIKEKFMQTKSIANCNYIPPPPPFPHSTITSSGEPPPFCVPSQLCAGAPPPAPPPPPPPLPPLPSLLTIHKINITSSSNNSQLSKSAKLEKEKKSNLCGSRPVISEDALKQVKLRKVTERPPNARRQSEPLVSKEMLSQVKLKPVNSNNTNREKPLIQLGNRFEGDTSLTSILNFNRILQMNTGVSRVKRLRKDRSSANIFDNSKSLRTTDRERSSTKNANNL